MCEFLPSSNIKELELERNNIGDDGILKFAEILPSTKLKVLNLMNNIYGFEGKEAIFERVPLMSEGIKLHVAVNAQLEKLYGKKFFCLLFLQLASIIF